MQRLFISTIALYIIFSSLGISQEMKLLNLDSLVNETLKNNSQLRAARNHAQAANSVVDQVTSWDTPQFGVEFYQIPIQSFPNPIKNNMETDYFFQQMIPFPGKLSAMGNASQNNAKMAEQNYRALENKLVRDLKSACYELYLLQQKMHVNAENQDLLKSFVVIARKQYEVGMGKQPDILRAQTELSKLINDGINLQKEQKGVEAMINTILNRPANSPLGTVPDIEVEVPAWTFDQLSQVALEMRPELKAMDYNIAMNKSELLLSKREYFPDLMARVMYKDMAETKNDFWSVMIGISFPLAPWSSGKYTSKVEENELNVQMSENDYANMKNMALFEVQDALIKVQANDNLIKLYTNTVIPQAEQTLQSTLSAYQTGKTEFLMLIDAYRMLLDSKLEYYMSVMNYMTSMASLEQAVGADIKEIARRVK